MAETPRGVGGPRAPVTARPQAETTTRPAEGPTGMTCSASMRMPQRSWGSNAPEGAYVPRGAPARPAAPLGPPVEISSLSAADRKKVADLWKTFGPKMVPMHEAWHSANGSGGTKGPGSGEKFLQFHANLMKDFAKVLETQDPALFKRLNNQLPSWDTTKALPKELEYPGMLKSAKAPTGIDWKPPGYLTAQGGGEPYVLNDAGQNKTIRSLNDIKTADELGRVMGASGMHAVGHVRLGGKMNTFASIATPPFQLWHGKMEEIRKEWLTTPAGKAAAAAHPPEGFLDPNANSHSAAMAKVPRGTPLTTDNQFGAELTALERQQPRASQQ